MYVLNVLSVNARDGCLASLGVEIIHDIIRPKIEVAESVITFVTKIQFEHMFIQETFFEGIAFAKNGIVRNKIARLSAILVNQQFIAVDFTCFRDAAYSSVMYFVLE